MGIYFLNSATGSASETNRDWTVFAALWMLTGTGLLLAGAMPGYSAMDRYGSSLISMMIIVILLFGLQGWFMFIWTGQDLGKYWAIANTVFCALIYGINYFSGLYRMPAMGNLFNLISILLIIALQTIILKRYVSNAALWVGISIVNFLLISGLLPRIAGSYPPSLFWNAFMRSGSTTDIIEGAIGGLFFSALPNLLEALVLCYLLKRIRPHQAGEYEIN
jgi:hypothetical protein